MHFIIHVCVIVLIVIATSILSLGLLIPTLKVYTIVVQHSMTVNNMHNLCSAWILKIGYFLVHFTHSKFEGLVLVILTHLLYIYMYAVISLRIYVVFPLFRFLFYWLKLNHFVNLLLIVYCYNITKFLLIICMSESEPFSVNLYSV